MHRRRLTLGALLLPLGAAAFDSEAARLLRAGRAVAVFRHAEAPGTYDPPGLVLADCSTQRNLDDEGRAQSRRLGAGFAAAGLTPLRVRSSPWCRCLDTARLAFGSAETWAALGSPSGRGAAERQAQGALLQSALTQLPAVGFEVWVTHNFVIADLCGVNTASAAGVVLGTDTPPRVLARLPPP